MLSCRLFDLEGEERVQVKRPKDKYPESVLVGSRVVSCQTLEDEHGTKRSLFVFPNLSIRVRGTYKMRFDLVDLESRWARSEPHMSLLAANRRPRSLNAGALMGPWEGNKIVCSEWTKPFEVFAPKKYPGNVKVRTNKSSSSIPLPWCATYLTAEKTTDLSRALIRQGYHNSIRVHRQ